MGVDDQKKAPEETKDAVSEKKYDDALSVLEKKVGVDNTKEFEALVSLIEQELGSAQKDLSGLLDDISNKKDIKSLDQKQMLMGLVDAATANPEQLHEASRDAAYEMLTGKKNQKKDFFKNLLGGFGIGGIFKNIWKKAMGVDLKAEEKEKKELIAAFEAKNAEVINNLKTKIGLGVKASDVKTSDPSVKKEEEKKPETKTSAKENEGFAEQSHYTVDEQKTIENVIVNAKEYEHVKYSYGGVNKEGIDCSGLWSQALKKEFKDEGQTFGRLTAALFDTQAPDISNDKVERGDWMFWEDPNGVKKGGTNEKGTKIYHIEMALGKPFEKDGKKYVKTYGSSSSKPVYDEAGKDIGNVGVGYRIREVKDNHHFAKPKYYQDLVQIKKENKDLQAAA